ncbi:MAG: hypothetical protein ACREBS_01970 [Nitrososphaerales archaeon]
MELENLDGGTPYERYLRQSIEDEKKHLDNLYTEFARSNSVRKQFLKQKIEETTQNIMLISRDLEKFGRGLSWLREPSKERDDKSERLEKISEQEPPARAPAAKPPAMGTGTPARPSPSSAPRPVIGTPMPTARPVVGTPKQQVGAKPSQAASKPQVGDQTGTSRPIVGTPIKAGTPVDRKPNPEESSQPPSQEETQGRKDSKKTEEEEQQKSSSA